MKRRDEGVGLGDEDPEVNDDLPANKRFKWNDSFWTDAYNSNIDKYKAIKADV